MSVCLVLLLQVNSGIINCAKFHTLPDLYSAILNCSVCSSPCCLSTRNGIWPLKIVLEQWSIICVGNIYYYYFYYYLLFIWLLFIMSVTKLPVK